MASFFSPCQGKTTNRRAGCGRSASPVRREGRGKPMHRPYPYTQGKLGYNLSDKTRIGVRGNWVSLDSDTAYGMAKYQW